MKMKRPDTNKIKKKKLKTKDVPKGKKEQVMVVAQEIKFARLLSGNEKKTRDRVLKSLKKWLLSCFQKNYDFKEDDFIRVWKGLFYAVWMSDKPLIQEELCESIAEILDNFPPEQTQYAILMTKAGLKVLATEWYGIDYHRMDKFLMLVRRYLRGSLRVLQRSEWSEECCKMYSKMLSSSDSLFALKTPHYARNSLSMLLHITDCFLEELSKVSDGDIPEASLVELLKPFVRYMCSGDNPTLCAAARRLLTALLRQSQPALQYAEATLAWKQMGCPPGGPEALEFVSEDESDEDDGEKSADDSADDDNNDNEKSRALDPRAGRVDVSLRPLPVPGALLAAQLRALLPGTASAAHRRAKIYLHRFEKLAKGECPLPERLSELSEEGEEGGRPSAPAAAHALLNLEKKLIAASDELALRGLSRKHRKRLLAKRRAGHNIAEELNAAKDCNTTTGDWHVESTEPASKKPKRDTSNKENQQKRPRRVSIDSNAKSDHRQATKETTGDTKKETVKRNKKPTENGKDITVKKPKADKTKPKLLKKQIGEENKSEDTKDTSKVSKIKKLGNLHANETKIKPITNLGLKLKPSDNGNSKLTAKHNQASEKVKISTVEPELMLKVKPSENSNSKLVKRDSSKRETVKYETPKKVKFVLKNNSMQGPVDYYRSVRQSPNIPYDGNKRPSKANLKPSVPSPINPFFKKKLNNARRSKRN